MGPLDGIRIIDMTAMLSGPYATRILGDMGADVVKVESLEGDGIRAMSPFRSAGMGAMFLHANRSKRSLSLDLKKEGARDVMMRLLKGADVFITNFRPAALDRLRLSYTDVREANPSIIFLNITGYGSGGRYASRPAYDDLIQGATGIPSLGSSSGDRDSRYSPIAIADRVTGLQAVNALLAALFHKERHGEGQKIEVPMFENLAEMVLSDHMAGKTFVPASGPAVFERYASIRKPFATKDGFLCVMIHTDKQWTSFFNSAGRTDLIEDEHYRSVETRTRNMRSLYQIVETLLQQDTTESWVSRLEKDDIPAVPLATMETLLNDNHLKEVGFFREEEHPSEGRIISMQPTSKWSKTQPSPIRHTPLLGEHNQELLLEVGLSDSEIEELRQQGVIGA